MNSHVNDVLVVGAGPAGAIAALVLARAGARVRVIDRTTFPRHKLCGDTLNPGSLAMLDRLRVSAQVRAAALPVSGMIVTGPGGTRVVGEYGPGLHGAAITRRDLDLFLLEEAAHAGAQVDTGILVRHALVDNGRFRVHGIRVAAEEAEHDLRARVVIAADGRQASLARALGLAAFARTPRRWAFGAYYGGVEGLGSCGEMHIRQDGYIGVAPVPGGLANVCVVRDLAHVRALRLGPDTAIDRAIAADPGLRDRFARATRATAVTSLGPLAIQAPASGVPGLLLAGDAAGFIDPMTGDGLRFAIRGGELAALAALRELDTGKPAHEWLAHMRRREFEPKWRVNRALRALVASPSAVRLAAAVSSRWSAPLRTLIAVAGDVSIARREGRAA